MLPNRHLSQIAPAQRRCGRHCNDQTVPEGEGGLKSDWCLIADPPGIFHELEPERAELRNVLIARSLGPGNGSCFDALADDQEPLPIGLSTQEAQRMSELLHSSGDCIRRISLCQNTAVLYHPLP